MKSKPGMVCALLMSVTLLLAASCASSEVVAGASPLPESSGSVSELPALQDGVKTLVVYYSQGRATKKVAGDLATMFGADVEVIIEKKARAPNFIGFMKSGYQATFKLASAIEPPERDPAGYGRVVICTPVWSWSLSPPVRAYLRMVRGKLPEAVGFVTVSGDTKPDKIAAMMTKESGVKPRALVGFGEKDFTDAGRTAYVEALARFASSLR